MSVLVVTGTGTGVGKTVVAAGLVSRALAAGRRVSYVKAAQTGVPGDEPDADAVVRLSGLRREDAYEGARFAAPLSPEAAARVAGVAPVGLDRVADLVRSLEGDVVVEGAGGLLVRYDPAGSTLADLARRLDAPVLVVAASGLGTLNATALTLEALAARGLARAGVVVGSWPRSPGLADVSNLDDLEEIAGRPLSGAFPEGSGGSPSFAEVARRSLDKSYGGEFDPWQFRSEQGDRLP